MVEFEANENEEWMFDEKLEVIGAAALIDFRMMKEGDASFVEVYGDTVLFQKTGLSCAEAFDNDSFSCFGSSHGNTINIYTNSDGFIVDNPRFIIHELGHSFESAVGDSLPRNAIVNTTNTDEDINNRDGFAGPAFGWQQSTDDSAGEIFGDMFIGWVYNEWSIETEFLAAANAKNHFMTTNMSEWIDIAKQGD